MTFWFTADTHFGHINIIKYANRPFLNVEEMNLTLIKNWNNLVQPNDTIYHLGDFSFMPWWASLELLQKLNGQKHLILGSHDKRILKDKELMSYFISVSQFKEIKIPDSEVYKGSQNITLCHYAMLTWNKSHYGAWQLHGHSHGSLPDDPNALRLDVGVDCWNFKPVSYEQIKQRMALKTFKPIDYHGEE